MNNVIEDLFYAINNGEPSLYSEIKDSEYINNQYEELVNKLGLDVDTQNELFDIYSGESRRAEQHGFEQGLKLGLRLAAEAFSTTHN